MVSNETLLIAEDLNLIFTLFLVTRRLTYPSFY